MDSGRSLVAITFLAVAFVLVGGLVALIVLAHIVGRTRVAHPGWWGEHADRPSTGRT